MALNAHLSAQGAQGLVKIAEETLAGAGATLTADNLPNYPMYFVIIECSGTTGTLYEHMRINDFAGVAGYAYCTTYGTGATTVTTTTSATVIPIGLCRAGSRSITTVYISNKAGNEAGFLAHCGDAWNYQSRVSGRSTHTDLITKITVTTASSTFIAGSSMKVFGVVP